MKKKRSHPLLPPAPYGWSTIPNGTRYGVYTIGKTSDGYWRVFQTMWVAEGPAKICDLLMPDAARQYSEVLNRRSTALFTEGHLKRIHDDANKSVMPDNPASCTHHGRDSSGPYCTKYGKENRAVCTLEVNLEACQHFNGRKMSL